MKSIQNYSINVKVLEEFNNEVDKGMRSEIVEALIVEFLIKYTRENDFPSTTMVGDSNSSKKEIP